ncbi:ABC transporter transmembrane domain-containing protein [Roseateles asaccharophilus]|uniref:Subfamily B ATP-binding cassette protein MsbA n=1 Tax=Roseateles asaccharophilus TaxID=582607 RepID=A0ABU2A5F8_9BURK|nr:ABC transporter transmembrane domain-containing protein [Roseateles asaccharophilus]MDR7332430.1 subfamily B ATP-binding cassette protein MsbA [Roseateles asaccharophilus]
MSPDTNVSVTRRLGQFVYPHRWGALLTVLAYIGAAATEPMIPKLIGYAFGEGFAKDAFPLWMVPVTLIGLYLMRGLFGFAGQYLFNWTVTRSVMDFRAALVNALMRLDAQVYTRMQPGTAVSKVVNDPQQILQLVGDVGMSVLRDGLPALAMLGYLFFLNWKLTLLSLIVTPLMALVMKKVNQRMRVMATRSYDSQLLLVNKVDDLARAWRVVRQFGAAAHERERFGALSQEVRRNNLKTATAAALAQPMSQLVASVGLSFIICVALWQARAEGTGVQAFAEFVAALLLLTSRLRHLSDLAAPLTRATVIAKGCFELMDAPKEVDAGTQELPRPAHGDLAMQEVRLTYPGAAQPALDGLTLTFPAGKTTALVGASGAGKSSIIHLLLGFGRPDNGRVLLDGADVETLTRASLRRQFAVVSQDIVLFDDSVAANIAYAQPRDDAKLEQVLRAAHLWDFVQGLPDGVETNVGANGSKLSGGQRQRLAIARALYKDAPIWIFDEATSALDTESERAVQQALTAWSGRKTLIVIAHRLSTIRDADAIHVLGAGKLVETGTHAELLARDGAYAAMVRAQAGEA